MRLRLTVALLLLIVAAGPFKGSIASPLVQNGKETRAKPGTPLQQTGWFQRPAGAGDYQSSLGFPNIERPPTLGAYLPANRDLQASCLALTRSYQDLTAQFKSDLDKVLAFHPDPMDPESLVLPRLFEKVGNLQAFQGDMVPAVDNLEKAYKLLLDSIDFNPNGQPIKLVLEEELGLAYMRMGEIQNCSMNHNAEMCIFPLSVRAEHKLTTGSEKAIEYFTRYLAQNPKNLEVVWLLNLAYMTLGKYPDSVPKQFLIPQSAFQSKEDIGRFTDVAGASGLDVVSNAGGVIVDDFDNDGFFDIIISSYDPCEPLKYFHNNGDGTFSDWSERSGLSKQIGGINIVQTDYNNDGWLDIYVMRGGWDYPQHNSLLKNNGDGTFTDVTVQSGLDTRADRTHTACWADFDNDGYVDLFIGHELAPSQLFRNRGDGTFEDVSHKAGVDKIAFTKGACWGDYDNDGYPDLYVSNYAGENFLYHNNRDGTFTDVAKKLHVELPLMSFPCWFFDYDNDGYLDLLVASFVPSTTEVVRRLLHLPRQAETMKLYRNTGKGTFEDVTAKVGLDLVAPTMGANFGDLDNDGFLDFYLGSGSPSYAALLPATVYRNHDGAYFADITTSARMGHLQKGHGIAFADINNDGDQDVFFNVGGATEGDKFNKVLFANPGKHGNHWISIKLVGVKSNRAAIGAKIKVTVQDEKARESIRYREVSSGGSFGANPLTQAIGLGKARRIKSIQIIWPASRTEQVFNDVGMDQFIQIKEFDKGYEKRHLKSFAFKRESSEDEHHNMPGMAEPKPAPR